jgi:hypothetical protein
MNKTALTGLLLGLSIFQGGAASLSITGNIFAPLMDSSGNNLADGSVAQVGYFLGVSKDKDPNLYTDSDWSTFTPIAGAGLSFPNNKSIATEIVFGTFPAGIALRDVVTDPDVFVGGFDPVRIAFRIFDSRGAITGADFNTVTSSSSDAILEPPVEPAVPKIGTAEIALNSATAPGFFWQDPSNPFLTSISTIPEPSTITILLLSSGLLLGSRRRS